MSFALKLDDKFTYADYLKWPENERWELIDGIAYDMTPAPSRRHQDVEMKLLGEIYSYLKGKSCKVYPAPFDVRLPEENEDDEFVGTVLQPDISVICDKNKLDEAGCKGAPDFIIEILSASTVKKDLTIKKDLYEKHGVKEYWIVDGWTNSIRVYLLKNNKYATANFYEADMSIKVNTVEGLTIHLKDIFDDEEE